MIATRCWLGSQNIEICIYFCYYYYFYQPAYIDWKHIISVELFIVRVSRAAADAITLAYM